MKWEIFLVVTLRNSYEGIRRRVYSLQILRVKSKLNLSERQISGITKKASGLYY